MIVLDCSAAIEIVRDTAIGKTFCRLIKPDELVVAPALLNAEFIHAIGKYVRAGTVGMKEATQYIGKIPLLVDEFVDDRHLAVDAFRESMHLGLSSYDVLYFVLARRLGATLLSLDKRLINACLESGVDCIVPTSL